MLKFNHLSADRTGKEKTKNQPQKVEVPFFLTVDLDTDDCAKKSTA